MADGGQHGGSGRLPGSPWPVPASRSPRWLFLAFPVSAQKDGTATEGSPHPRPTQRARRALCSLPPRGLLGILFPPPHPRR